MVVPKMVQWRCVDDATLKMICTVMGNLDYYIELHNRLEMMIDEEMKSIHEDDTSGDAVEDYETVRNFLRNSMTTENERELYALALKIKSIL
ncbi:cyun104 [Cyclophragma undans nucleopolyhedrovirus]|uniref:Cyun104 n=1 Tax=Cyclophragma undans nucleopolyhedrovirus TaxID=1906244 RepID=A0A288QZM6_9ABAC|nr:cyun104 [Cyclophragma undans nucleopolyhedrovirus]AOT85562.1 cyun104 [Cyclophragma undans nucleopolyhedrovirus]